MNFRATRDHSGKRRPPLANFLLGVIISWSLVSGERVLGQTLDRTGFTLTFSDEFTDPLSLADWFGDEWKGESGKKWYAHTPFGADFGDAPFEAQNAYTQNGNLVLKAHYTAGTGWHSALISSDFPTGKGFSQQYGYFEARMALPSGQGTWPAFWLFGEGLDASLYNSSPAADQRKVTAEIDIMENYGSYPNVIHQVYHRWNPNSPDANGNAVFGQYRTDLPSYVETTTTISNPSDFHTYGVLVQPDYIIWYIDDQETKRMVTPEEAKQPLFIMLNYALGAGYNLSGVGDPSYTLVDYVRVSSVPEPSVLGLCGVGMMMLGRSRRRR